MSAIRGFSAPSLGRLLLFLSLTFLYVASFWQNSFHAADHWWFNTHQLDSEALVIGRLVETERHGMNSYQGRLGVYELSQKRPPGYVTNEDFLYYGESRQGEFRPYDSQIGGQGVFFSAIDQALRAVTEMGGEERVHTLHLVASLLTATLIAALLYILFIEFGLFVCVVTAVVTLYFQWLIVFGKNLYWAMFLIYAPVVMSFYLYRNHRDVRGYNLLIFLSIALAVLLKLFSGFEYLTTITIGTLCPVVYFGIVERWRYGKVLRHIVLVGSASTFAFVVTFFSHVYVQSLGQGLSFGDSLGVRLNHALYRLHKPLGDATNTVWTEASNASVWQVVGKYWNGNAIDLGYVLGDSSLPSVSFSFIVILVAALIPLVFISERYSPSIHKHRRRLFGLVAIILLSFAGTLSWYVFAKVHSYFHGHMNHVLWHIPFTFFAVAYIALLIQYLSIDLWAVTSKALAKKAPSLLLSRRALGVAGAAIIVAIVGLHLSGARDSKAHALAYVQDHAYLKAVAENGTEISVMNGHIAFYHPTCSALDLKQRFFLHVYPGGASGSRQAEGFDFNWRERAIYRPGLFSRDQSCLALIKLPSNFNPRAIRAGQFVPSGERTWSTYIDVAMTVDADRISAFNLTDTQWKNGVSTNGRMFFVENTERYRELLTVGKKLIFSDFSVREISDVYLGSSYINVSMTESPVSPQIGGFPNTILVVRK